MKTVWTPLFTSPEFLHELSTRGYSVERNFSEYKSKHHLKLSGPTPGYLSIDFYSRQPKELRDRNCYVIRTGKGNLAIFEENRFRRAVGVRERGSGFRVFRGSGCWRGR